ncbi:MAG: hypothetical protein EPN46_10845 [Candidimonas sp.]|nr:MAG: hypothetical protein EPN77_15205 [Candidimonas sp.]TAM26296.1 MAG: hypothetical protein EPN62_02025 [Candidimonas sp.]TAM75126.1 MAG: hypothetical protein EPN46_10845 [Candidimonas sp.]
MSVNTEWRPREHWGAWRAACVGFVLCVLMAIGPLSASAVADSLVLEQMLQIEAPGFVWSGPQELKLFEVPVFVRRFTVAASLDKAAQALAHNTKLFQKAQASKQKIMLSGDQFDSHWVAEIAAAQEGAQGFVSVLSLNRDHLNRASLRRLGLAESWVPQPAQLYFSQQSVLDGQALRQQVYRVARPIDELNAQLRERLQALGWRDVSAAERPLAGRIWRLGRQRLVLVSASVTGASTLFVQHFQ